jgi:thiamine pyrophosphate-dependent acetolactate synthase large subunit-like protein
VVSSTALNPPAFDGPGVRYRDAMSVLDRVLPDGVNIVVDVGNTGAAAVHYLPVRRGGRFAPSRLGAGLAAMLPGLPSVDVNDADGFSAAMRTALDVDGPSVVSIACAADEIPPFATFLEPSVAKNLVCQDITQENRTDVALSV